MKLGMQVHLQSLTYVLLVQPSFSVLFRDSHFALTSFFFLSTPESLDTIVLLLHELQVWIPADNSALSIFPSKKARTL